MKKVLICERCNQKFLSYFYNQRWCCRKCYSEAQTVGPELICKWCKKKFHVRPALARAITCSRACSIIERANREKLIKLPITKEQFFARIKKSYNERVVRQEGCWTWNKKLGASGYPTIWLSKNKILLAHRVSWMIHFGEIPEGIWVLHKCDNTFCTNPDHLFLGTAKENTQDMFLKKRNRCPFGEKHYLSKLKEKDVIDIRKKLRNGMEQTKLAKEYRITSSSISDIKYGRTWKYLL